MKKTLLFVAAAAASVFAAPAAQAAPCTYPPPPGYVTAVPTSNGHLGIICVLKSQIPAGYSDATGGNPGGGMDH